MSLQLDMAEHERRLVSTLTKRNGEPLSGPAGTDVSAQPVSQDGPQTTKPGRRRRAAEPKNKLPKAQHFYFVDRNSSSKEKRAHVMRHHVQEKRKQRKMSHEIPSTQPITNSTPCPIDESTRIVQGPPPVSVSTAVHKPPNGDTSLQIMCPSMKSQSHPSLPQHIGSPITIMDASRKDPFSSLPIESHTMDHELADYWRNKLSYWSGQNLHVKNQIFRTAMGHPLSFEAVVLSYCARWKAQLYDLPDSWEIQTHVGHAAKSVEEAFSGSAPVNTGVLAMSFGGMALHEGRFGSKQLAQTYIDRAVQLMRPRTGANRPVEVFIHYIRYLMMPPNPEMTPTDHQWLLTFLRGSEDLMRRHSTPEYLSQVPSRAQAFQMQSPLFSLLSNGPRPSQVPQESRVYVVRDAHTQEVSQTAALIYITAMLWEYQENPDKTARFLQYLNTAVKLHHLDRDPACETLLWLLLEEGYDSDLRDPERGWSTGALLKVHKTLRPELQFHFNEILMSFLSLSTPVRGIDFFEKELLRGKPSYQ
ncbi:uncharacterized protein N7515_009319 [Penicillium bovifimosum]|uniref:Uncharacterized protein n=1 Tax=Penicillium bovifimosum TaxID=126998 RepID=A0A9W9KVP9_9EURO|nr:uncharacterized protein N7515_009319 [Penicillium bovifimosum]KAJ5121358.1 hypothetical protein N7515_009319 [Penicillium bovifimosum]